MSRNHGAATGLKFGDMLHKFSQSNAEVWVYIKVWTKLTSSKISKAPFSSYQSYGQTSPQGLGWAVFAIANTHELCVVTSTWWLQRNAWEVARISFCPAKEIKKLWWSCTMHINAPRLTVIRARSFLPTQWPCKCVSKKLSWISQICHRSSKIKAECKSNFCFISTCFLDNNLANSAESTQSSMLIKRLVRSILDSRWHFHSLHSRCHGASIRDSWRRKVFYTTYQVFVQNEVLINAKTTGWSISVYGALWEVGKISSAAPGQSGVLAQQTERRSWHNVLGLKMAESCATQT